MKVVVIDDERAMHLIMKRMLSKFDKIQIVECFQDTATAYLYLESHDADLVFVDISMPREGGLDFAKRLRASGVQVKLVFVTSHKEFALSAFDVHAYDYIVKPVSQERLNKTLHRVLAEQARNLQQAEAAATAPSRSPSKEAALPSLNGNDRGKLVEPLTNREIEILKALAQGLSNKEIADQFVLTEGTVKNHVFNLYGKLDVKRRSQAIVLARELGILK
ncbi:response regulator transcription factor [Paenibacillus agricola]|uniref:Response regulator transcription factor n=1 Tax=Paenibacillus agricola TaxID=2716264 RepID=A0ABX0JFC8_9BACL|nr:response regulator transcription factor [Paenibacillus agricola]NHN33403.1 response regulator transcription factor [Paenibacillus agricola]